MANKILVAIVSAGRASYLKQTWASFEKNVKFSQPYDLIAIDDFPDTETYQFLSTLPTTKKILHAVNYGLGQSINELIQEAKNYDYIFHLEDDFLFNREVSVDRMIEILENEEKMVQLRLVRQPVYPMEIEANSCITPHGFKWEQQSDYIKVWCGWSFNPNLAKAKWYTKVGTVPLQKVEVCFSQAIYKDLDDSYYVGCPGQVTDSSWITHIGEHRKGAKF